MYCFIKIFNNKLIKKNRVSFMLYILIKIIINFISLIVIEFICMVDLNGCFFNKDLKIVKN